MSKKEHQVENQKTSPNVITTNATILLHFTTIVTSSIIDNICIFGLFKKVKMYISAPDAHEPPLWIHRTSSSHLTYRHHSNFCGYPKSNLQHCATLVEKRTNIHTCCLFLHLILCFIDSLISRRRRFSPSSYTATKHIVEMEKSFVWIPTIFSK